MTVSKYLRHPDRRIAFEAFAGGVVARSADRFLRKRLPPSLSDLASIAAGLHGEASELLKATAWSRDLFTDSALARFVSEHRALAAELRARYTAGALAFPDQWAIETGTSFLLYALVRSLRPSLIIEMGVANGQSSYFILRALEANASGQLVSFDIATEVGGLLTPHEREDWDVRLLDARRPSQSLVSQLASLPAADLCFHDAEHSYFAQSFDLTQLCHKLGDYGVLVMDDIDESYAFIDFARNHKLQPEVLIDGRKAVGVLPPKQAQPLRHPGQMKTLSG